MSSIGSTHMNGAEKEPSRCVRRFKNTIHLWEFLLELLNSKHHKTLISWTKQEEGEFKLDNPEEVAKQWGQVKRRPGMNYDKLSRALRYYYQNGIIKKVPGQRLVYRFHELPYEYKSLRHMNEKDRRHQLQNARPTVIQNVKGKQSSQDEIRWDTTTVAVKNEMKPAPAVCKVLEPLPTRPPTLIFSAPPYSCNHINNQSTDNHKIYSGLGYYNPKLFCCTSRVIFPSGHIPMKPASYCSETSCHASLTTRYK